MRSTILAIIAVAAQAMSLEGQNKQVAVATTKTNSLAQAAALRRRCGGADYVSPALAAYEKMKRAQRVARFRNAFHLKRMCRRNKACMKYTGGRRCPRFAVNYYRLQCLKSKKCMAARKVKKAADAKALMALFVKVDKKDFAKQKAKNKAHAIAKKRRIRAAIIRWRKIQAKRRQQRAKRRQQRARRIAAYRAKRAAKAKVQVAKDVNNSLNGVNAKLDNLIRKVVALRGGKAITDIKASPIKAAPKPKVPSPKPVSTKKGSGKPLKASANGLFKTGLPSNIVTQLDKDIWAAQNKLRADPAYFIKYLEKQKKCFAPGSKINTCGPIRLRTQEGVPAIDEAIRSLKSQKALKPMKWADGLFLAVRDHCLDQGRTGKTGHSGSDRSSPFDRINRYGKWHKTAGENISYGSKTGDSIIMQLFVDDGVASRGHRHNLQKAAFGVTGICTGKHSRYRTMCTLIYSGGYTLGAAGKAEIKKLGGKVV